MLGLAACGGSAGVNPAPAPAAPPAFNASTPPDQTTVTARDPVLPPHVAMFAGLLPLRSIAADSFRLVHPTYDGRGVLLAILDSGIDAGLPGLQTTTTGQPKILDLRDFSGEGRVALSPVMPSPDGNVTIGGRTLTGVGRIARMATPPFYAGVLREITLGALPEADVNGNGHITDELPVLVARSSTGWFAVFDTDGDGALNDEDPTYDYLAARETFAYGPDGTGPMTIAVNLTEDETGVPIIDLYLDNSSHGSHVAGIATGHTLFGVDGFDGVAPGAQILGLKIANNARGGVSVTGSMLKAMNYAADFAQRRGMPLVVNLSFGVGNEAEGAAAIDSLIDEFALRRPDVVFVISAGNDGPGLSTVGFPGSAEFGISVCALFPGVFAQPPRSGVPPAPDVLGWWSARGGETAKPDLCAPGVAFSNVPVWQTGEEISGGTSMAAPQIAGGAALLLSGLAQNGKTATGVDIKRALMATARRVPEGTIIDAGAGVPHLMRAYRWLLAEHKTARFRVRALPGGGNVSRATAAFRPAGLASPGDTLQRFAITPVAGDPPARLLLRTDAAWLRGPDTLTLNGAPATVTVQYDAAKLRAPGVYVGTVSARSATDTLAGSVLHLVNTIVIPHLSGDSLQAGGVAESGRSDRYFLPVRAGDGGLAVRVTLANDSDNATLYLFEPAGQPFRGGSTVEIGGEGPQGEIVVPANDLVPGVYEAVVVAPPASTAEYALEAALPPVVITDLGPEPRALLRNRTAQSQSVEVTARLTGAAHSEVVRGAGARAATMRVAVPEWAERLVVDVQLPRELWHTLTDFGVTVFDDQGRKLVDGPLHYAFGRMELALDSTQLGRSVVVELFPAFAHLRPAAEWNADVRVALLAAEAVPFTVPGQSPTAQVELAPDQVHEVRLGAIPEDLPPPEGFQPLVEVEALGLIGAPSVRRGIVPGAATPAGIDSAQTRP